MTTLYIKKICYNLLNKPLKIWKQNFLALNLNPLKVKWHFENYPCSWHAIYRLPRGCYNFFKLHFSKSRAPHPPEIPQSVICQQTSQTGKSCRKTFWKKCAHQRESNCFTRTRRLERCREKQTFRVRIWFRLNVVLQFGVIRFTSASGWGQCCEMSQLWH